MRSRGKPTGENLSSFVDVKTNWKIDRGIKVKINNKLNPGEFEASAYSVLIFAKIGQFLLIFFVFAIQLCTKFIWELAEYQHT